jgi:hypothetical protein
MILNPQFWIALDQRSSKSPSTCHLQFATGLRWPRLSSISFGAGFVSLLWMKYCVVCGSIKSQTQFFNMQYTNEDEPAFCRRPTVCHRLCASGLSSALWFAQNSLASSLALSACAESLGSRLSSQCTGCVAASKAYVTPQYRLPGYKIPSAGPRGRTARPSNPFCPLPLALLRTSSCFHTHSQSLLGLLARWLRSRAQVCIIHSSL